MMALQFGILPRLMTESFFIIMAVTRHDFQRLILQPSEGPVAFSSSDLPRRGPGVVQTWVQIQLCMAGLNLTSLNHSFHCWEMRLGGCSTRKCRENTQHLDQYTKVT